MEREGIKEFLKLLGCHSISDRSSWVMASCPFAKWTHEGQRDDHPSFGVSVGGISYFNCFACKKRGRVDTIPTILTYITGEDHKELRAFVSDIEGGIFDFRKDGGGRDPVTLKPLDEKILDSYMKFRHPVGCISMESIELWSLRFDKNEYRMVIPIRDRKGNLVGLKGRFLGNADAMGALKFRYYSEYTPGGDPKRAGIWLGMHFPLARNKHLILVEGERDVILLKQAGVKNVWSAMGASITNEQINELENVKNTIALFFDNDKAGQSATMKVKLGLKRFGKPVMEVMDCPVKDPAEAVEKGMLGKVLKTLSINA